MRYILLSLFYSIAIAAYDTQSDLTKSKFINYININNFKINMNTSPLHHNMPFKKEDKKPEVAKPVEAKKEEPKKEAKKDDKKKK